MSDNNNNSKKDSPENIDEKLIAGHEYDGIQELDNPLPRWWLLTFFGTIVFGVAYYFYYEMSSGPSLEQELAAAMTEIRGQQTVADSQVKTLDADEVEALMGDESQLKTGEKVFLDKCAVCHGKEGQGLIGPNLVDKYWLHGEGQFQELATLIEKGVPEKGMPPWKGLIVQKETEALAAYLVKIQGTTPSNPKAAQGKLIE